MRVTSGAQRVLGLVVGSILALSGCSADEAQPDPSEMARAGSTHSSGGAGSGGALGGNGGDPGIGGSTASLGGAGAQGAGVSGVESVSGTGNSASGSSPGGAATGGDNTGGTLPIGGANTTGGTRTTAGASNAAGSNASGGSSALPSGITVWLAGDSTVANGQTPCPVGWGKPFAGLFGEAARVVNSAVGGRSIHTWLYYVTTTMGDDGECVLERNTNGEPRLQDRWQKMLTEMKAGDYLMIQFGINDGSPTCDRHVGLAAFEASHVMMAEAARERGAHPIFLTPVSGIACNGSRARGSRGSFVDAVKRAGEQHDVPVIDLHARSVALYDSLGFCPVPGGDVSASTGGEVGRFFCEDHTHFDTPGAARIAELVASALKEQNIELAQYLRDP